MSGDVEMLLLQARAGKETVPAYLPRIEAPPRIDYGYVALSMVQLVNLLNPAAISLAGGMFFGNPVETDWVIRAVRPMRCRWRCAAWKRSRCHRRRRSPGLIGAAALAMGDPTNFNTREA